MAGELEQNSRQTLLALLALTAILVSAVQFGRVSSIAKDIGRMRALGASRGLIVALVLALTSIPALGGVALGTIIGCIIVSGVAGILPSVSFAVAIAALVFLASVVGAIPPAMKAAFADPVSILRVP